jgi:hypothetical protein
VVDEESIDESSFNFLPLARSRDEGYFCLGVHGQISLVNIFSNHNLIMADQSIAQLADIALR